MVNRNIVLDTNVYSKIMVGDENVITSIQYASHLFLPVIVIAELLYGFRLGKRQEKNLHLLSSFLSKPEVKMLNTSFETAEIFALIKEDLKKKGKLIPTNDIWIAAFCLESGSPLYTFDRHFEHISGLRLLQP